MKHWLGGGNDSDRMNRRPAGRLTAVPNSPKDYFHRLSLGSFYFPLSRGICGNFDLFLFLFFVVALLLMLLLLSSAPLIRRHICVQASPVCVACSIESCTTLQVFFLSFLFPLFGFPFCSSSSSIQVLPEGPAVFLLSIRETHLCCWLVLLLTHSLLNIARTHPTTD
jgi:hypothetical protein